MTIDLWCLLGIALWGVPLAYIGPLGRMLLHGVRWGISNRDVDVASQPWAQRGDRAFRNHLENLPMFAVAVLVVHVTGKHDDVSAWASIVFVAARVLHGLSYVAGVTWIRTGLYYVALGCIVVVMSRVL